MGQALEWRWEGMSRGSQAGGTRDLENLGPGKGMGSEFDTSGVLSKGVRCPSGWEKSKSPHSRDSQRRQGDRTVGGEEREQTKLRQVQELETPGIFTGQE